MHADGGAVSLDMAGGRSPPRTPRAAGLRAQAAAAAAAFGRWWAIARLYFTDRDERRRARALAGGAVALSLATTLLLLRVSDVQSAFNSALTEKKPDEFSAAVRRFVAAIAVAAPLLALADFSTAMLAVRWRAWLADHLMAAYFDDAAYYRIKTLGDDDGGGGGDEPRAGGDRGPAAPLLGAPAAPPAELDNPDQRLTDDVRAFAAASVSLGVGLVRQAFYLVAFGWLLASIAPRLLLFQLAYAALGTGVTFAGFGRRLVALTYRCLRREADLRFDLVRVREAAESVAFYGAGGREAAAARRRLGAAVDASVAQARLEVWLALWQNVYDYATILAPACLMAPRYFAGEVRFGVITQVSFAFGRIDGALAFFVDRLGALSALAAQADRLHALAEAVRRAQQGGGAGGRKGDGGGEIARLPHAPGSPCAGGLELQALTLLTPGGGGAAPRALCARLSLALPPRQSLLVVGPSGCGKSGLLRAAAGLWTRGGGTVRAPPRDGCFFLPQRPYMPLGTLRDQLTFPDAPAAGAGPSDAELLALLDAACLPGLGARFPGGLGARLDWAAVLSVGEQQRVAFARLLRRRPALAFLDEATSGLDGATEAALYERLAGAAGCWVSVGHRPELARWHTHVLSSDGAGGWALAPAAEWRRAQGRAAAG